MSQKYCLVITSDLFNRLLKFIALTFFIMLLGGDILELFNHLLAAKGVAMKAVSMAWLDNTRVTAMLAVVSGHTAADVVVRSPVGSGYWWIGNFYDSFLRWALPVFVMISGALLLDPGKNEDLKTFYTKRASRILVPMLFWSAFFLLLKMAKALVKNQPLSLMDLAKKLLSGETYYHMWFLYMIIMLYLFTPFFRKIIAHSTRNEGAVLVFFTFLISVINTLFSRGSELSINWFLSYIPYFFIGYLIQTDKQKYSKSILWGVFLASSFLTAVGCYLVAYSEGLDAGMYFYEPLSITGIPMSVSIMYLLKSWAHPIGNDRLIRKLSLLTLGVYLIHPIFLQIILDFGFGPRNFYPAVAIPIIGIIAFSSSLIGSWVIHSVPYLRRVI